MSRPSPLSAMLPRLLRWASLDDEDRGAILDLPYKELRLAPTQYLVREGDRAQYSCLLTSGFALGSKIVGDGGRQIVGIHVAGDLVDLQNAFLDRADHNVQALTAIEVIAIPREAILALAERRPLVARAMWHNTLVDAWIHREWAANIGRRDAKARLAHLLCELAVRVEAIGAGSRYGYELPMTQEHLADCLGLTSVHVNRTLKALAQTGVLRRQARSVRVADWNQLTEIGDFNGAYLHLEPDSGIQVGLEPQRLSA